MDYKRRFTSCKNQNDIFTKQKRQKQIDLFTAVNNQLSNFVCDVASSALIGLIRGAVSKCNRHVKQ